MRLRTLAASLLTFSLSAHAAPPPEAEVQGLYEGTATLNNTPHKVEARVVAVGKGKFKVLCRGEGSGGQVVKHEMTATTAGDAVTLSGKAHDADVKGEYAAGGTFKGAIGDKGTFELKRVVRQSPTLGAKPPEGAVVLLGDVKQIEEMTKNAPKPPAEPQPWEVVDGEENAIVVPKGGMQSKRTFDGGFKLHVEFQTPLMPAATGQGRGNSGCYLPNGDEVQVLDSFGMTTYTGGGAGGLYKYKDPDASAFDEFNLASLPPGQWQTYDIEYKVTPAADGKGKAKATVTVVHNGIKLHDNAELQRPAKPGRFHFQDHGNAVQYRNIWVVPEGK